MTQPADSTHSPRRYVVLSLVFMLHIVMICGSMAIYVLADRDFREVLQLARVAVEIDQLYQQEVNWDRLFDGAMNGMLGELDQYSTYHEPSQFERIHEEFSGSYVGIGVTVLRHEEGLLVMSVRENGPAAEVGMLSGDVIIEVDTTNLAGLGVEQSTQLLRGREGTTVDVTVFRPVTDDTVDVTITRRDIVFQHIPYAGLTADSLIYVRILDFDAGTSRDLESALDSLLAIPAERPRGIIIDLRGNPGGLFSEAYNTADLFLEEGQLIVGSRARSRWFTEEYHSTGDDMTNGLPMAVLVDQGSASSSEIFAGAMKQLGRGILVGDTTFGKGLVQGFNQYPDGSALRLTVSRYYLEGDVYLNEFDSTLNDTGRGLAPDYVIGFIEHDPFPLAIERTLLLNRFANIHTDEIIQASGDFGLSDDWVNRFRAYALEEGFEYRSPLREDAEVLLDLTENDPTLAETRRVTESIVRQARAADSTAFDRYGNYIKFRLKQLAFERRYGMTEAYARAIVPDRPDIQFAAQLLKDGVVPKVKEATNP